jgi:hypothetical protein
MSPEEKLRETLADLQSKLELLSLSLQRVDKSELGRVSSEKLSDLDEKLTRSLGQLGRIEWNLGFLQDLIEPETNPDPEWPVHQEAQCQRCGEEIEKEWQGTGSPIGSMHESCARESQRENPSMW